MVNTEHPSSNATPKSYYNILNIVVNTEQCIVTIYSLKYYNILNIVVNTELDG